MKLSIAGTGSALPEKVLTNNDLSQFLDTSDEWISTRTGILERRIIDKESVSDLAVLAAKRAMENAGVAPEDIDYILCPTIGADSITPNLACLVQMGIGATCPALDINAACSGFLYGLEVAAGLFAVKPHKNILMVAAEGLSRFANWTDRATCVLFGDGAGAVVLQPKEDMLYVDCTATGNNDVLYIGLPVGNFPGRKIEEDRTHIYMDGNEVYKFAVNAIIKNIKMALDKTGLKPDEIKHVLLHQANIRIIEAAQKRLGIPVDRYPTNIHKTGNTSAASIAILLDECNKAGRFENGDFMVLSGFGGGLTTGTAVLRWNGNK